jgi:hypothetical protein
MDVEVDTGGNVAIDFGKAGTVGAASDELAMEQSSVKRRRGGCALRYRLTHNRHREHRQRRGYGRPDRRRECGMWHHGRSGTGARASRGQCESTRHRERAQAREPAKAAALVSATRGSSGLARRTPPSAPETATGPSPSVIEPRSGDA